MTFQDEVREIVCVKFADSKGMRQNKCMSIDYILPCAYKGSCGKFCSAIIALVEKIVGEDNAEHLNSDEVWGYNQAKREIRDKLEEK